MYDVSETLEFNKWLLSLKDKENKARIVQRIKRMSLGNFGDVKQLYPNMYEARLFFGSGYRIYYTFKNNKLIILLLGGDKSSQKQDIQKAIKLLEKFKE